MSTLSFDQYSRKKGTIETVTSSNAKLPRARVEVVHPYLALMGLYCGGFAGMYSETALNIALPQLSLAFGVDVSVTQWLVVGYMLVIGVVLPFASLLMKWFSARKLTLFALGAFFVGAVASAVAPSFPVALAGRAVQGIGTGLVLPIMFAMVLEVIPPHKIGAAMGTNALVIMFAPAIGPTLAGALVGAGSWRLVFASFAVMALVGIVFAWKFEVNPFKLTKPAIDAPSVALSVVGFGGIVLGAGMASSYGWTSPVVLGALVAGIACLALYARRQLSMEVPIIDVRIFSHQEFRVGAVCMMVNFGITLSAMYVLPQFYQSGMLLAVAVTGVVMLPGGRHRERAREHDLRSHLQSDRRARAGDLRVWAVHRGGYGASLRHAGISAFLRRCLPCGHDARRAARDVSLSDARALFAAARAFSRWLHGAQHDAAGARRRVHCGCDEPSHRRSSELCCCGRG